MIIINMLLLSTLAGIISGVTGVGGGVLFTPLFKMFCDSGDFACRASDTVYLSMIAVLCSNAPGLFFSSKRSFVPVQRIRGYFIPLMIGIALSQLVIYKMSSSFHDIFLCVLVGYINLVMRFDRWNFCYFIRNQFIMGSAIGLLSGVGGISGSLFFIPVWRKMRLGYRQMNAASTAVVLISSLTITVLALMQGWQPPIDLRVLLGIVLCATAVNFIISRSLKGFTETFTKKLYDIFFSVLFLFYLFRVLIYVCT